MTDTDKILEALYDVKSQGVEIQRQLVADRAETSSRLADLTTGLAVHVAKCGVMHQNLDHEIVGCKRDIKDLYRKNADDHRNQRDALVQRVNAFERQDAEEVTQSFAKIRESGTYWTRTAVTVAVSIALGLLAAGVGLAQVAVKLWN